MSAPEFGKRLRVSNSDEENWIAFDPDEDVTVYGSNTRILVYVIPGALKEGPQPPIVRLPFDGTVVGVHCVVENVGTKDTLFQLEKCTDMDASPRLWTGIFLAPQILPLGKSTLQLYQVSDSDFMASDFLRLNIVSSDSDAVNMTLQVAVSQVAASQE